MIPKHAQHVNVLAMSIKNIPMMIKSIKNANIVPMILIQIIRMNATVMNKEKNETNCVNSLFKFLFAVKKTSFLVKNDTM